MSLTRYKEKRDFKKTSEPAGGGSKSQALIFVVQKHDATRLHYDLRLEMSGVLKSWAVPKGPSTDPSIKRLAMQVENHPYDYRNFEGIIPKGNYGAGTVIIWDFGTYDPIEHIKGKKAQEKHLLKQLKDGSLKLVFHGKKLKGEWALVKTQQSENSWLLIKHKDKYASDSDITEKSKSVVSGKTIEQLEKSIKPTNGAGNGALLKSAARKSIPKKSSSTKSVRSKTSKKKSQPLTSMPDGAKKAPFPTTLSPMLATLTEPFDQEGWLYEIKWDGYRAIAFMKKDKADLVSRNSKSFNDKFYPVLQSIREWGIDAVVDGEIVVLNENGVPDFSSLQNWRSEKDGDLAYYVFDLLWLEGYNLTHVPLKERRQLLQSILPVGNNIIRMSETFDTPASELLKAVAKMKMEGIMAKKEDSLYYSGTRSKEWLKMKSNQRHEIVIGGFTRRKGTSKQFSSLLVGVYRKGKLHYTGKIGTGFSESLQKDLMSRFKSLNRKSSPFDEEIDVNKPSRFQKASLEATVTWLKPVLVGEVSYTETTPDGLMRHPSFEGMREDKKAGDVHDEIALPAKKTTKPVILKEKVMPATDSSRKSLLNPTDETQIKKVNGKEIKFSNLDKVFWPKEKIEKRDLLNYYYQVAPYILPYLKNRPQSLNRYPDGYAGKSFYQKDVTGKVPDWMELFPYRSADEAVDKNFLVAQDEASLLFMVNLGCIEINPWSSTVDKPDHPTWCVLDLDPDKNEFDTVIKTAQVAHDILSSAGMDSFCKTSGSTGLHIYIPLHAKYDYEQSKELARIIVTMMQKVLPRVTSIERVVSKRKGKIYLDFLQNRPQATLAAAYSVRPKPGATVSMPLEWDEVKKGLKISNFTMKNVIPMLKERGDIFKGVLGKGIDLKAAIRKLEAMI